jgi:hypothetical protein
MGQKSYSLMTIFGYLWIHKLSVLSTTEATLEVLSIAFSDTKR